MENSTKGMVANCGQYKYKAKHQIKPASPENVTKGGDLRSRPTGGSKLYTPKYSK